MSATQSVQYQSAIIHCLRLSRALNSVTLSRNDGMSYEWSGQHVVQIESYVSM